MRLVFTDEARADLIQIGDWIAQDNPLRAITFVDELESHCWQLTSMPEAYQLVPRFAFRGVRRVAHGNYLIFYRVVDDTIEVIRVLHGARDFEAILFPES